MIKPDNSEISFVIESQSLLENQYVLNEKGLIIDLCQDYQVHVDLLSGIKITRLAAICSDRPVL